GVRSRDLGAWRRSSATDMQDARFGGVGIWELTRRWYCRFRSRLGRPRGLRCEVGATFLTRNTLRGRGAVPHAEYAALLAFGCDARCPRRAPCYAGARLRPSA